MYIVVWDAIARRQLHDLDPVAQKRVVKKAVSLESNPMPPGAIKLSGTSDTWRVRAGDYRILYTIDGGQLVVLVVKIGHRREVYR